MEWNFQGVGGLQYFGIEFCRGLDCVKDCWDVVVVVIVVDCDASNCFFCCGRWRYVDHVCRKDCCAGAREESSLDLDRLCQSTVIQ